MWYNQCTYTGGENESIFRPNNRRIIKTDSGLANNSLRMKIREKINDLKPKINTNISPTAM